MGMFKKALMLITLCLCSAAIYAKPTELRVAIWLSPSHPHNAVVWPEWKKWVEKSTDGRVKVVFEDYTGHPKALFDLVEDGVFDAAFAPNGYIPGRFQLTSIAEIPGEVPSAESGSVALWRTYNDYFLKAKEYDGLVLLALFVHGPGQLHAKFPLNNLSDLKNKKIRLGGGLINELGKKLGITPVGAPSPKSYEMMQQGVADGTFLPAMEQKLFRLSEISSDLVLFPKGLYNTAFSVVMNEDFFYGLKKNDQEAILSVSGEKLSRLAGKAWGDADLVGIADAKSKGVNVVTLSPDDQRVKDLEALSAGMDDYWINSVKRKKVDAKGALDAFRKHIDELTKE